MEYHGCTGYTTFYPPYLQKKKIKKLDSLLQNMVAVRVGKTFISVRYLVHIFVQWARKSLQTLQINLALM